VVGGEVDVLDVGVDAVVVEAKRAAGMAGRGISED